MPRHAAKWQNAGAVYDVIILYHARACYTSALTGFSLFASTFFDDKIIVADVGTDHGFVAEKVQHVSAKLLNLRQQFC